MSTNDVERALHSGIHDAARELIALHEDQWFERKSTRVAAKDLAVALVAFANAEGGTVVVGLHDGRTEGTKGLDAKRMGDLRQAAIDHTVPPVRVTVDQVGCIDDRGEVDALLVFRVPPGESVHELGNGDCYLRVGDESRKLGFAQRQELHYDRGISQFDGQPARGIGVEDLDQSGLREYRDSAGATGTFTRLLRARGLLTRDDEVTNAGYLLFAPDPSELFPQAHVRVLRFRERVRGVGSGLSLDAEGDRRLEGPIPVVIGEARDAISRWQPRRRALTARGTFEDIPVVPEDAWLEGLVNAVVHRSYSLAGDHIRVEIYPDRIEIESPGRFPGLADPSRPLEISRYARNPRIARVCTDLSITLELGEGIKRMFDQMRDRGLTDPLYRQGPGSVRLVLSGVSRIPADVLATLPRGAEETLNLLRSTGSPLGTGDIMTLTGLSRPTLVRHLNALRDADLVEWRGQSPKDPRAVWSVVD